MEKPLEEKDLGQNITSVLPYVSATEPSAVPSIGIAIGQDEPIEPSEDDLVNLRRIGGQIPAAAWLVALFSGAERFAYYALQAPLRNRPLTDITSPLSD